MDRDSYSRGYSPSEESLDQDTDLEGSQDQHPLQMILFDTPGQKGKVIINNALFFLMTFDA
jgi:hypothetical protein